MSFTRPSINTIYTRIKADMESRVTGNVKIPSFSLLDILARVFAGAIHLCYGVLVWLSNQFFPDTADEDYLIRIGLINGVPRNAATFASGTISLFYIPDDEVINVPIGTSFTSADTGLQYQTTEAGTIPIGGNYTGPVVCTTEGEIGNTSSSVVTVDDAIDGKPSSSFSATGNTGFDGGVEVETIDAYRQRLLIFFQTPPAGGRDQDYQLWALEISGVDRVWVYDTYIGAGTVGIIIADSDFQILPTQIKTDVQNNINLQGPLGVKKDVLDPVPSTVVIDAQITPNTTDIQTNITNNINALFNEVSAPGATILLSAIRNAYANSGVTDYVITDIVYKGSSIGVVNIESQNFDLPYIDTLNFVSIP